MPDMDKEFVEYVVKALVNNPEGAEARATAAEAVAAAEEKPAPAAVEHDAEAEMVARTKREFADLDDLEL
jgi:hypothetical protein